MPTDTPTADPSVRQREAARARYMKDSVETMSPARLVTMLYDALVTDLQKAEQAIKAVDYYEANRQLVKSQAILIELRSSLRPETWSAGPRLAALYEYLVARDRGRQRGQGRRRGWRAAASSSSPCGTRGTWPPVTR